MLSRLFPAYFLSAEDDRMVSGLTIGLQAHLCENRIELCEMAGGAYASPVFHALYFFVEMFHI